MAPNAGDISVFEGPEWVSGPAVPKGMGAIIYQPGGTAVPSDTVTTWADVQAFITATHGKCIVYIDDSITTPATVPAASGITTCFGRVELRPFSNDPQTATVLQIESGATLRDLYAVTGRLELQCNPATATPSLDWSIDADGGSLLLAANATLSNAATAGASAVNIADTKTVSLLLYTASIVQNNPDHPLFNIADGGLLELQAFDSSTIQSDFANGNGAVTLLYDMSTASQFGAPGTPPSITIGSLYLTKNLDDLTIEQTFTTATINNDIFQLGPRSGIRPVTFRGIGGGGGGGGGSGATATGSGSGGAAGGAPLYQEFTVDVDFSHTINVVCDPGGASGGGGSGGGGTGLNGDDGGPSYVLDATTNIVLCAFMGATGGQGGQTSGGGPIALSQGGSNISGLQYADGTGFVGAGGVGGGQGTNGQPGVANAASIGATLGPPLFSPVWLPGAGGTSGDPTQGGGGGGGGQGMFGNGGDGGSCIAGATTPGATPPIGTGGGGGGGAGGGPASPVTPPSGSAGGTGS